MNPSPRALAWAEVVEPAPEPVPPPGGWRKANCTFESHLWELEVEDGRASIVCTDPCDSRPWEGVVSAPLFDPAEPLPVCLFDWESDLLNAELPVTVTYVDDSTPSTPAGPAEHGYYLEVRPLEKNA